VTAQEGGAGPEGVTAVGGGVGWEGGAAGPDQDGDDFVDLPWEALVDHNCFGCSPKNLSGLRLRFSPHPDGLVTRFRLGRAFESYPGVVHGGILSTICDEAMGNLLVLRTGKSAFTVTLRMRFVSPLKVDHEYSCVARLRPEESRMGLEHAAAEILGPTGRPMATATGVYKPVSMDRARDHLVLTDDAAGLLQGALSESSSKQNGA